MTTFTRLSNGHTSSVNCLAYKENDSIELASASADSTCRIWDLRTSRSVRCITKVFEGEEVSCVKYGKGSENFRLYAAAGSSLFEFDLRNTKVIVSEFSRRFSDIKQDEINEIDIHHKELFVSIEGKYLAYADDVGESKILDLSSKELVLHCKLKGRHQNICNTLQFRPKMQSDLVSGALDSTLVSWDFKTGKPKTIHEIGLYEPKTNQGSDCAATTSGSQALNPPLVHSVCFTWDARYVVSGLGDSTISIFSYGESKPLFRFPAHNAAVCQVKTVESIQQLPELGQDQYLIYSAGNDSKMKLWQVDLPYKNNDRPKKGKGKGKKGKRTKNAKSKTTETPTSQEANEKCTTPVQSLKLNILLENKPNWILPLADGRVALADTSNDITIYNPKF